MNSVKDLAGEAHYFEETVNSDKIKHLLDNVDSGSSSGKASTNDKIEGMKYLLAVRRDELHCACVHALPPLRYSISQRFLSHCMIFWCSKWREEGTYQSFILTSCETSL